MNEIVESAMKLVQFASDANSRSTKLELTMTNGNVAVVCIGIERDKDSAWEAIAIEAERELAGDDDNWEDIVIRDRD